MSGIIKKLTKVEFSKRLTTWILSVYAIIVFAMIALLAFVNPALGGSFIAILGILTPIIITNIGFYFNKSKAENLLKIENSTNSQEGDTSEV